METDLLDWILSQEDLFVDKIRLSFC